MHLFPNAYFILVSILNRKASKMNIKKIHGFLRLLLCFPLHKTESGKLIC